MEPFLRRLVGASGSIKGFVEHVTPRRVSGWCIDKGETPVEVELFVDSTRLGTARADVPRKDIQRVHGCLSAGFVFPISSQLFQLLPHGGRMQAVANGRVLPIRRGCNPYVDNPSSSGDQLLEMLQDGYRFSLKSGRLFRPVVHADVGSKMLNALEECSHIFHQATGKRFFVCYGTLLGLVRDGGFIEHDDDVDVCFLAESEGLEAAWQEFRQVVSTLQADGERISVVNGAQLHWHRSGTTLDVFMAWMEENELYMYNAGGKFRRDQIYPLHQREFEGRNVLVPNNPEALLELIYGPSWTVPDPMFRWRLTPAVSSKMRQLRAMRDSVTHNEIKRHWSLFYNQRHTTIPSSFAASVATELKETCQIVDIGCGNGRDSLFFARLGHEVLGVDIAASAVGQDASVTEGEQVGNVSFEELDVSAPDSLARVIRSTMDATPLVIYARFFFHAITEEEETATLDVLAEHLPIGARCYFEFRTSKDEKTHKHYRDHYRRFINLDAFLTKALRRGTMDCIYTVEGQGMAKFDEEDPFVGRVHLRRR